MSIVYAAALVSILKSIDCPMLTLMFVAKPWMLSSPAPSTAQTDAALPGLAFRTPRVGAQESAMPDDHRDESAGDQQECARDRGQRPAVRRYRGCSRCGHHRAEPGAGPGRVIGKG